MVVNKIMCLALFYCTKPNLCRSEWCNFMGAFKDNLSNFHVFPLSLPVTKEISYEDLKALLGKSQDLLVVDVRTKEEVDKGCIPGSVHIPRELLLN